MKTNFKKVVCSLLVIVICLTMAPLQGSLDSDWSRFDFRAKANTIDASGQCGDDLYWDFNSITCELHIAGTGDMYDFFDEPFFEKTPWLSYIEEIKTINIDAGLTSIGSSAFRGCTSVTDIYLPESVYSVGEDAFYNCDNANVHIENLEAWCHIEFNGYNSNPLYDGGLLYVDGKCFTEFAIPEGIRAIGDCAFIGFSALEKVIIPYGVTGIGTSAFFACSSLETIYIPNSVTFIDIEAFYTCSKNLKDVYFIGTEDEWNKIEISSYNDSLTQANIHFIDCPHLTTKDLPAKEASCTEVGYTAGTQCTMCGETLVPQTEIPVKDHSYNTVVTLPTCTTTGYTTYTCSVCSDTYIADEVAALGHTEELVNEKAATATNDGYTGDTVCSVCDELLESGEIIPAIGETDNNCSHMCHKSGFMGFIWKIVQFFWKLFNMNPICECGVAHY